MRPSLLACVLITACSPFNGGEQFHCQNDGDCGAGGMCAIGDLCAFPNSACPDPGLAYGDSAGPLSGMCVPPVGITTDANPGGPDPMADAFVVPPDAPPTSECEGDQTVMSICIGVPQPDRDFTGKTLLSHGDIFDSSDCDFTITLPDSGTQCKGSACSQNGPQLCVIQGHNITLSNTTLRDPTGSRPLVFVATGDITVSGPVDATTKRGKTAAPGAATGNCMSASARDNSGGGGGGGGGSYGSSGGNGGKGDGDNGNGGSTQSVPESFTTVRSGCHAGDGADSDDGVYAGRGGDGGFSGGVVYLIAKGNIHINAVIDLSGMGGGGGGVASGGGGGGPGGFLGLDGKTVSINAQIIANGGAGGGGAGAGIVSRQGNKTHLDDPQDGSSGQSGSTNLAIGGNGGTGGGKGGNGTDAQNGTGGEGSDSSGTGAAGGGGGGGQGIVWLVGTMITGQSNIFAVPVAKP
jgi:hypothetical protein